MTRLHAYLEVANEAFSVAPLYLHLSYAFVSFFFNQACTKRFFLINTYVNFFTEKIENDRKREQANNTPLSGAYNDEDFSDIESNSPDMEHVEPVVLFRDVSRLLQNTSLLKVGKLK